MSSRYLVRSPSCPVVLRPHGSSFKFVAAACVHGVMKGEAWLGNEDSMEDVTLV